MRIYFHLYKGFTLCKRPRLFRDIPFFLEFILLEKGKLSLNCFLPFFIFQNGNAIVLSSMLPMKKERNKVTIFFSIQKPTGETTLWIQGKMATTTAMASNGRVTPESLTQTVDSMDCFQWVNTGGTGFSSDGNDNTLHINFRTVYKVAPLPEMCSLSYVHTFAPGIAAEFR